MRCKGEAFLPVLTVLQIIGIAPEVGFGGAFNDNVPNRMDCDRRAKRDVQGQM